MEKTILFYYEYVKESVKTIGINVHYNQTTNYVFTIPVKHESNY